MALREILACPVCHAALDGPACAACGRAYAEAGGVLDLTPVPPPDAEVLGRWQLWEALQANGERAYVTDPPSSLSVGERADARAFAAFARLDGLVLDVGCGPQARPSYADGMSGELVGIDPLTGEQPRRFQFVKGIAEYLPFAGATFDRVLFATSIDHVLSPSLAVADARRVTKPGGEVIVWLGEPAPAPALRARIG
ncbi:MAG: methyltransferase domain-containing protein, partial [Solirubrobacteraceae bacterium]